MKKGIICILCLIITGCASVHKNIEAVSYGSNTSDKLKISAEINDDLSSEYFGMIEFTLENLTGDWLSIKSISIDVPGTENDENIRFTTGSDFRTWSRAISKRNRIEQYNSSLAYGAIIGVSSAAAIASENDDVKRVARDVASVSAAAYSAQKVNAERKLAESNAYFPEGHILYGPQRIPPGLFTEAWLLINTDNDAMEKLVNTLDIVITYQENQSENYRVKLFNATDKTYTFKYKWQRNVHSRINPLKS